MVKNDWYRYSYEENEFDTLRTSAAQQFKTYIFTHKTKKFDSYKDALIFNATEIKNDFENKRFALMLSGGSDSEVMLRASIDAQLNFIPYIFRYENDYNLYDVSYAITLCESHQIKYKLVDFNVTKFFETESIKFAMLAQSDRPRLLPQLKFLDFVDEEHCLHGAGDINWKRLNDINYNEPGNWVHSCNEHEMSWEKYLKNTNRTGVPLWFRYTPELQLATANTLWSQQLVNDQIYGKTGTNSSKILGYREAYPDMLFRVKKSGLEDFLDLATEIEKELIKLNGGLIYRQSFHRPVNVYINEISG